LARNDKTDHATAREQRLATALRQNLRKRKLQQEHRQKADGEKPAAPAADSQRGKTRGNR
jgi:hypothetical protein